VDLELSAEQVELRTTVRRLLASDPTWAQLEAIGVPALLVPEADGGLGLGMVEVAVVAEELGRALYDGPWLDAVVPAHEDRRTVALGADALGAAQAVFELAVEYAKVRHQFGQPIGAFQAVQHLCVDMYETVELARGGVLHAAWACDGAPAAETHAAVMRLRAFADRLVTVADTAIQVFGGIGYTWEHDAHRYLERLMAWASAGPDPSAARIERGRALLLGSA
jgi:alkylation response protein AidB-like acyl-CoA dehydrogenase